ncbi:MAG: RDD family protein [Candidatus Acidiferrales bacterium]
MARRLEGYRSRRYGKVPPESQPVLSFGGEPAPGVITTAVAPRTIARIRPTQRVEIHVSQPQLDFSVVDTYRVHPAASSFFPIAELVARRFAGLLDAAAILAVFSGFLAMFRSLGGQLGFLKINFAIYAIIFFLIYILYFGLFTLFAGATLGMQVRGLSVAAMDGAFPDTRQLLWRSFGYFLSGGTLLLGFLWALWDEDHLTWQDRVSHTYITSAPAEEHSPDS